MQWKVVREVGSDFVTLRVGSPTDVGFQALSLPLSDWVRIADSIDDLNRPEPPPSWSSEGTGPRTS